MQITVPPELSRFIEQKLAKGQYRDASAVVAEALQVMMEQEAFTPEHERYLCREVARGIAQADRGQFVEFDAGRIIADERRRLVEANDRRSCLLHARRV